MADQQALFNDCGAYAPTACPSQRGAVCRCGLHMDHGGRHRCGSCQQPFGQTGRERKNRALDHLEDRSGSKLERVRGYLHDLYARRYARHGDAAGVSADDARVFVDSAHIRRGPWLGSVFRERGWIQTGWKNSREAMQNARTIRVWRWGPASG